MNSTGCIGGCSNTENAEENHARILAEAAQATGHDVSEEDMKNVLDSVKASSDAAAEQLTALNTDELDEVAGGGDHSTCSSYTYCKEITVHKG